MGGFYAPKNTQKGGVRMGLKERALKEYRQKKDREREQELEQNRELLQKGAAKLQERFSVDPREVELDEERGRLIVDGLEFIVEEGVGRSVNLNLVRHCPRCGKEHYLPVGGSLADLGRAMKAELFCYCEVEEEPEPLRRIAEALEQLVEIFQNSPWLS